MNPGFYQPSTSFKYVGGLASGMELPGEEASSPPAPFQHIISEQAKSFLALQELQNEVGALLEFRDVVMETFPQLRGKLSSRGRWEPGVRVRKKPREETSQGQPRSRSNSRSKGGSSGTSAVQDSGFCTQESKKTPDQEAEDELWNLLDLIHTKGSKLRLEVESLQDKYQSVRRSKSLSDVGGESREEALRREKDLLLDRVTEMEAENLANLAQTNQLLAKLGALAAEKRELEERVRQSNSGFTPVDLAHGLGTLGLETRPVDPVSRRLGDTTPDLPSSPLTESAQRVKCLSSERFRTRLGTLDGIISSPKTRIPCAKGLTPDKQKTAAILKENNVIELQRHLIMTIYENQDAHHRLEELTRCKNSLNQQFEKLKEENEDLRFQLEEKSIELEGTRARVRLLERLQQGVNKTGEGSGAEGVEQCSSSTESAHHEESPARKQQRPPSRIPLKAARVKPRPGLVRPRKSSESSFNSTCSSPSIRTPPPPPQLLKKQSRPPLDRNAPEPEPKELECVNLKANSEAVYLDSLEREKCSSGNQELDRSLCSAVASKTWRRSLEYFDSIDSSMKLNSFNDEREALAEFDSLDQMTSDMV